MSYNLPSHRIVEAALYIEYCDADAGYVCKLKGIEGFHFNQLSTLLAGDSEYWVKLDEASLKNDGYMKLQRENAINAVRVMSDWIETYSCKQDWTDEDTPILIVKYGIYPQKMFRK